MRHSALIPALGLSLTSVSGNTSAADLPEHEAFSVLVVADEVNPNQLSDAELTQPSDFATALQAQGSGMSISGVTAVDSQCSDVALEALTGSSPPDVVLYFAHRAAKACGGQANQTELVAALQAGLEQTTGIVVFHHGLYPDLYQAGAKDSLLELVGGSFEGIEWNTTMGQRVFNVGGDHFITGNGLRYEGNAAFGGVGNIASGEYPYFDNIPDERYPTVTLLTQPNEERTLLFASDSGGERVLGYALKRPGWQRSVVAYQPGEYQPNALDARDGNNFQVLANALYFASRGDVNAATPTPGATDDSSSDTTAPNEHSTTDTTSSDDVHMSENALDTSDSARTTVTTAGMSTTNSMVSSGDAGGNGATSRTTAGATTGPMTPTTWSTTDENSSPSNTPQNASGSPTATGSGCSCRVGSGHTTAVSRTLGLLGFIGWPLRRSRRLRRYFRS